MNLEYSASKHNSSHTVALVLSAAVLVLDTIADYDYEYDTKPELNITSCCQLEFRIEQGGPGYLAEGSETP
jgi:hypothetical protein